MPKFYPHKKLSENLEELLDLTLSKLYLLPDSNNPWAVLVPKRMKKDGAFVKEIHELSNDDQITLIKEITNISEFMESEFAADKMNVGALGNMVPQLHIHIIARFKNDKAWPGAIWGTPPGSDREKIADFRSKFSGFR